MYARLLEAQPEDFVWTILAGQMSSTTRCRTSWARGERAFCAPSVYLSPVDKTIRMRNCAGRRVGTRVNQLQWSVPVICPLSLPFTTTMGKVYDSIPPELIAWVQKQKMFWVATAPLSGDGHVNLSPKGIEGTFHIEDANKCWYEDLSGSGTRRRTGGNCASLTCVSRGGNDLAFAGERTDYDHVPGVRGRGEDCALLRERRAVHRRARVEVY